jgi:hypothetical protein
MKECKSYWGLLRRRECLRPTWQGWTVLVIAGVLLLEVMIRSAYPFLAVTKPIHGGLLVVEGWQSDSGMQAAVADFKKNSYEKLYVTGGPLTTGGYLSQYENFAQLGAITLAKLGLSNEVQAVPAPLVRQDRTYASAVALRQWLRQHGLQPTRINVISTGPHARRTRMLFEKAMGPRVQIGIVAEQAEDYDPARWWTSSMGFRTVTGEIIAYLYARLLFWPPQEPGF